MAENLARVLPNQVDVVIEQSAWSVPPLFTWLRDLGQLEIEEMRRVFNMGIGLVLVVRATAEASVCERLTASGATVYPLGQVVGGTGEARIV